MTVYVKEYKDKISVESVKQWTKSEVTVLPFNENDAHELNDIVFFSHEDDSVSDEYVKSFNYYYFEDVTESIMKNVMEDFNDYYHYCYYYLLYEFRQLGNPDIDTVYTGSSYGVYGIDYSMVKNNSINISMTSQDLFYAIKGVYLAYQLNPNIRNVVLCFSYYCFNIDLSKSQNESELLKVSEIYEPLYHDSHNAAFLHHKNNIILKSSIFDIDKIHEIYANSKFEKWGGYINESHSRESFAERGYWEWFNSGLSWKDLPESVKDIASDMKTTLHNKSIDKKNTVNENILLLNVFVDYFNNKKVNILFVATPKSESYIRRFSSKLKKEFFDNLNKIEGTIHFLDLTNSDVFVEEDFIDPHHLGNSGAVKMTRIIVNTLEEIQ